MRAGSQLRRQIINAPNKRRGKINGYSKNAGVSQAKKAAVYIAGAWLQKDKTKEVLRAGLVEEPRFPLFT